MKLGLVQIDLRDLYQKFEMNKAATIPEQNIKPRLGLHFLVTISKLRDINYNYNVIMQGINFNQRPTSKTRRIPQSHTWLWWIHVVWWASKLVPSSFSSPFVSGVCCSASVPSRVSFLHSLLELSIMPSAEGSFSHLHPLPVVRPGCPIQTVVEGWHLGDSLYYPIEWVESKDGATWELVWGLGYSGSSLPPVQAYLWATSF